MILPTMIYRKIPNTRSTLWALVLPGPTATAFDKFLFRSSIVKAKICNNSISDQKYEYI